MAAGVPSGMARTLKDKLVEANDRPSGFDYLRLTLAVSIVAWHGVLVCYGHPTERLAWQGPIGPFVRFLVPSFFALSGFLVMGSLYRNDLVSFLALRALRIFPALGVELLLSAFLIGMLATALPLADYVTDPGLYLYFGNLIGVVQYELPGVFRNMPAPYVNLQLWTIPFELDCYVALSAAAVIGLHRRPGLLLALALGAGVVLFGYDATVGGLSELRPSGALLILSFLVGAALFALRDRVSFDRVLFAASAILSWVLLARPETQFLAALPVAYCTVCLGVLDPRRLFLLKGADYSYGLYLYGFPIQQMISYLFPDARLWWINVGASLVVASLFAAFSWHVIEKRVLAHRRGLLAALARMNGDTAMLRKASA